MKKKLTPWEENLERRAQEAEEKAAAEGVGAYSPEAAREREELDKKDQLNTQSENKASQLRKEALRRKYGSRMEIEIVNDTSILMNLEKQWGDEGFYRFPPAVSLDMQGNIEEKLRDFLAASDLYRIVLFNEYALIYRSDHRGR